MSDDLFMRRALELAAQAAERDEVPVGAVVVHEGQIIAEAFNEKETSAQPTHHAEILAIERAAEKLGRWRLQDCDLFVTLEPCLMCAGAIVQARLRRVVFATRDPKAGAVVSLYQTLADTRLNHRPQVEEGLMAEAASRLLTEFFRAKRRRS